MSDDNEKTILNEQVFEIRYKPNTRFLDHRGSWANQLSSLFGFTEWRIIQDRIDIFDKSDNRMVFISYKNAGFVYRYSKGPNDLISETRKLLRFMFRQKPIGDPILVQRLGVKSRFAREYMDSFDQLLNIYRDRIFSIKEEVLQIFNAKLIDLGSPLNFETSIGKINSMTGPMEKEQLKNFFPFEKNPPNNSVYFEIDYFIDHNNEQSMGSKEISKLVEEYIQGNWTRYHKFCEIIFLD